MSVLIFVLAPFKSLLLSLLIDNLCFSSCPGDVSCMFSITWLCKSKRLEKHSDEKKSARRPRKKEKLERKKIGLSEFLCSLENESCVKNALLMTTRQHLFLRCRTHSNNGKMGKGWVELWEGGILYRDGKGRRRMRNNFRGCWEGNHEGRWRSCFESESLETRLGGLVTVH